MTDHFPECAVSTLSGWHMIIIVLMSLKLQLSVSCLCLCFFCELRELVCCLTGNAVSEKRSRISTEEN